MKKTEADLIQLQNHTHQKNQMDQGDAPSLPRGWEIKKLGEVCDVIGGGTPSKKNSKFYEGNILWATVRDMKSEILSDTEFKITEEAVKNSSTNIIPKGNVIIATRVGLGKVCLIQNDTAINQDLRGIVPKNSKQLDNGFLFQWFKSISNLIVEEGTGATVQGVKLPFIKDLPIPLPPLPEQQRIVSILDKAFAAIAKAKANAEQNLKNAKELFESYLQGVFENGNWETKTLKEVAKIFGRGKSKHRPRNWEGLYGGNYPFIQTGEVRNANKYISSYTQTYNEVGLAQSKLWKKGTICITIAANIAETAILDFDACIPDSIIGFEVDEKKADLNFAYYLLQYFKAELQKLGKGSAQDNINLGTFENQYFPFPTVKEQQTIVRQLDALRAETQKLEAVYQKKIDDLEELKKSILQKAFAGELKVSEPLINAD